MTKKNCDYCNKELDDLRVGTFNNKWYHSECLKEKQNKFLDSCMEVMDDISLCLGCNCMTHSIRKGRASYVCPKCGYNKSLGDYYQAELEKNE